MEIKIKFLSSISTKVVAMLRLESFTRYGDISNKWLDHTVRYCIHRTAYILWWSLFFLLVYCFIRNMPKCWSEQKKFSGSGNKGNHINTFCTVRYMFMLVTSPTLLSTPQYKEWERGLFTLNESVNYSLFNGNRRFVCIKTHIVSI